MSRRVWANKLIEGLANFKQSSPCFDWDRDVGGVSPLEFAMSAYADDGVYGVIEAAELWENGGHQECFGESAPVGLAENMLCLIRECLEEIGNDFER